MSSAPLTYELLIIAYGNPLRRDDGAGLALGEKLGAALSVHGITVQQLAVHQLLPELALTIANPTLNAVLFVDTVADRAVNKIIVQPLTDALADVALGHHLSPQTLLLYAARLYGHCPPAWLVAIPGTDFGHGAGFSPRTAQLLENITPVTDFLFAAITAPTSTAPVA